MSERITAIGKGEIMSERITAIGKGGIMSERISAIEAKQVLDAFWNGNWKYTNDDIGPNSILLNGKIVHLYLVGQTKNYRIESERGHLYSPKDGYPTMLKVNPKDIIFHKQGEEIKAISVAMESAEETFGVVDGLRIDNFFSELTSPLVISSFRPKLINCSPFGKTGCMPQRGYIHPLDANVAEIFLSEIKSLGNSPRKRP